MSYSAYVLSEESREALGALFPPKFQRHVGHHVTVEFGIDKDSPIPEDAEIRVTGYFCAEDGLEAFSVSINGEDASPSAQQYHITWSLDPEMYQPRDSNTLVRQPWTRLGLDSSCPWLILKTTPAVLG